MLISKASKAFSHTKNSIQIPAHGLLTRLLLSLLLKVSLQLQASATQAFSLFSNMSIVYPAGLCICCSLCPVFSALRSQHFSFFLSFNIQFKYCLLRKPIFHHSKLCQRPCGTLKMATGMLTILPLHGGVHVGSVTAHRKGIWQM